MKKLCLLPLFFLLSSAMADDVVTYTNYKDKKLLAAYGGSNDSYETHATKLCRALGHERSDSFEVRMYNFSGINAWTTMTDKKNRSVFKLMYVSDDYDTFEELNCK